MIFYGRIRQVFGHPRPSCRDVQKAALRGEVLNERQLGRPRSRGDGRKPPPLLVIDAPCICRREPFTQGSNAAPIDQHRAGCHNTPSSQPKCVPVSPKPISQRRGQSGQSGGDRDAARLAVDNASAGVTPRPSRWHFVVKAPNQHAGHFPTVTRRVKGNRQAAGLRCLGSFEPAGHR